MSMLNRKSLVVVIALTCVLSLPAASQDPIAPHSAYEPPAAKDAAAFDRQHQGFAARPAHHK